MDNIPLNLTKAYREQPRQPWLHSPVAATRNYLAECESLRGLAIVLVMLFHAHIQVAATHRLQPDLLTGFIISGNTGVTLFFVLSGFLLNLPFLRAQPPRTATFFRNRALRILPLYIPLVVIGGIYCQDLATTVQALLFWNIDMDTLWPFGSVWWSLMVEVQFYLLLPCLYAIARSQRLHVLVYPIFIGACLTYLLYTGRLPWQPDRFYALVVHPKNSILCLWPVFFIGGLLAWIHDRYGTAISRRAAASRVLANGGADLLLGAILLALALVLRKVSQFGPVRAHLDHFDHVVVEAALWALLIAAILYLPLKTKALWSNPLLAFFGTISYSLYLLHALAMNLGTQLIGASPLAALAIPKLYLIAGLLMIAVALSVLTYTLIEKPALNLKRYDRRPKPETAHSFCPNP